MTGEDPHGSNRDAWLENRKPGCQENVGPRLEDLAVQTQRSAGCRKPAGDRLAVVGDVHGDAGRLDRMLRALCGDGRQVVLVGDYVNRGSDSKGVLSLLAGAKHRLGDRLVLLSGNHELAMLEFLDRGILPLYEAKGGLATIRSYLDGSPGAGGSASAVGSRAPAGPVGWVDGVPGDLHRWFRRAVPADHERLLREQLDVCLESDGLLVSHMGFDPEAPEDRSLAALVGTPHPELLSDPSAGQRAPRPAVVFGHYVQTSHRPWRRNGLVCLDTGCGTVQGPLTALLLPEDVFVSV